jgi:hypothetical protein
LDDLRRTPEPEVEALPEPRIALLLGGRTRIYPYSRDDETRFETALSEVAATGASFLVTASRRTHPELLRSAERATEGAPRLFWRGPQDGPNPYRAFLANADWFIVTADSVNMTGEACATGRPVYVFHPSGGSPKFDRFHKSLETMGCSRPMPEPLRHLDRWAYEPQFTADLIAREIERRYRRRRTAFPGFTTDSQASRAP